MMAVRKLMGDSTKKSPCFLIHSRLSPSMMVREAFVASVMSSIPSGERGLQRWVRLRSSKLMT